CEEHNAWADTAAQPRVATESLVTIPHSIQPLWLEFQAIVGGDVQARFYEAFHFDDNEPAANELARLVLVGTKRATAGLAWSFEAENRPPPKPSDLGVVTTGKVSRCVSSKPRRWRPFPSRKSVGSLPLSKAMAHCAIGAKSIGRTSEEYANVLEECQVRECQSSASASRPSNLSIERAFNGGAHWPLDQAVGH
ncbi:MAG TPA: hypothetical protein VIT23_05330, partial [Terrimicrobiaceae bacterium]